MLRLPIEDDGCGFDVAAKGSAGSERRGLGHAEMRERLALIGGELEIKSSVGAAPRRSAFRSRREGDGVKARTRIVLADDHPVVLDGLRNLIQAEDDSNSSARRRPGSRH